MAFRNLRFAYAAVGINESIVMTYGKLVEIWDCQFINCGSAFSIFYMVPGGNGDPFYFYNVLFSHCASGVSGFIEGGTLSISAVNVTADEVGTFVPGAGHCLQRD